MGPPQTLAIVQARGAPRRELHACLRSGRVRRRAQGRTARPGVLTDMVLISERPAEVDDRAVPGHWEGDLIIGGRPALQRPSRPVDQVTACRRVRKAH